MNPSSTTQPDETSQPVNNPEETAESVPGSEMPESLKTDANKYADLQDQFVRLQADFQNFRKRVDSERQDLLKYGASRTLEALLPVLDNLTRGTASLTEQSDAKLLYQSFQIIMKDLNESLAAQGLKPIDAVGQPFDPFYHEAISNLPSTEHPENTVMQVVQSGYILHDRVLRPAMVIVSSGSGDATDACGNPFVASQPE